MKARNEQAVPAAVDAQQVLTADSRAQLDAWIAKYPADRKRSAVLAGLRIAQKQNVGHLTDELIAAVAAYLGHRARRRQRRFATGRNWASNTRRSQHTHHPLYTR